MARTYKDTVNHVMGKNTRKYRRLVRYGNVIAAVSRRYMADNPENGERSNDPKSIADVVTVAQDVLVGLSVDQMQSLMIVVSWAMHSERKDSRPLLTESEPSSLMLTVHDPEYEWGGSVLDDLEEKKEISSR